MKICFECQVEKPELEFWRKAKNPDGLDIRCAECMKKYQANRYRTKPEYAERIRKRASAQMALLQAYTYDYLTTHPCVDCGETDIIVLDFDHVHGEKVSNVSKIIRGSGSLEKLKAEISKCEVRCANDHRRKTAERNGLWSKTKYAAAVTER